MWTRADLKARAKQTLRGHYWTAFLAALLLSIAGGGNLTVNFNFSDLDMLTDGRLGVSLQQPEFLAGFLVGMFVVAVFSIVLAIFVAYPLEVGVCRYFTSACCRQYELGSLGFGFSNGRFWNVVKTQFLRELRVLLWSLLLVIPGIVKSYAYSMVPYILADNPYLPARRALELSDQMTRGHKGAMFGLSLSFIGWYLLGALACGVGILFVEPYRHSTFAELYMQLRHNALQNGLTTMEELCLARN